MHALRNPAACFAWLRCVVHRLRDRLRRVLAGAKAVKLPTIEYKPGYTVRFGESPIDERSVTPPYPGMKRFKLEILADQPDATLPALWFTMHYIAHLEITEQAAAHSDYMKRWIADQFEIFERHEMDEWLKFDGVHYREAHRR